MDFPMFVLGFTLAGAIGWYAWWKARREVLHRDDEEQRYREEQKIVTGFMHNLVESIGAGIDRQALFERLVVAAVRSSRASSACVFERRDNLLKGVASVGLFPPHRPIVGELSEGKMNASRVKFLEQVLLSEEFAVGEGLVGSVAQTGKGILIRDAAKDPRVVKHRDPALVVHSALVVPINFRDRNIAVLAVVNPVDGMPFEETDFSLALALAEESGLVLQNVDLMQDQLERNRLESDLAIASNIQSMLLPKRYPSLPELDISTVYEPAQKIGGDFYDVFGLDDGRIGVAIADVSGKGIPASLLMAICQANLRHFAKSMEKPSIVLSRLNEVLHEEMQLGMFVTVIYAVIDFEAHRLTLARAGHELPLSISKEGTVRFLASTGMGVGMVTKDIFDLAIEDLEVPFDQGDALMLYTDGVTESVDGKGAEYTKERLAQLLRDESAPMGALQMNERVLASVQRFSGSQAHLDDFTIVTIKHR